MYVIQYENLKIHRDKLIELKNLDSEFNYSFENDKLFFLMYNEKIYGYAIIALKGKNVELKKIFINPKLRYNGYGTILLKSTVNWLIKNDYDNIIVKNHKKMNNFLEKQKFIKTENGYVLLNLTEHKKRENSMLFVSKFAIVINIILSLLKIISGKFFNSASLLADGLNSLSDLITNILVILGLKVGGNPEDKEHPFGHGKIESIFSVIIGTFIMITAFNMIQENIINLINNQNIKITPIVFLVTILSLLIKIFQFLLIKYKTRKYRGALINSLLKDYNSDIIITTSVIIGVILSQINPIFDVIVGILVSFYIMKEGYKVIKENALILLDSQDEELLEKLKKDISEFIGVENAHDFKMTTSGKSVFITADVRINKNIAVDEAHEITNNISKFIKHKYDYIKSVTLHVEPMYENE